MTDRSPSNLQVVVHGPDLSQIPVFRHREDLWPHSHLCRRSGICEVYFLSQLIFRCNFLTFFLRAPEARGPPGLLYRVCHRKARRHSHLRACTMEIIMTQCPALGIINCHIDTYLRRRVLTLLAKVFLRLRNEILAD